MLGRWWLAKSNAARGEAGGTDGDAEAGASEGRVVPVIDAGRQILGAQILVEAPDLCALASLEEIEDLMNEAVDLDDRGVIEAGHRDRPGWPVLSAWS